MKRKVGIAISAMILAAQLGSPLAADEPTTAQLRVIATYLSVNNVEALRAYLLQNPGLLEGETQLADLLRDFLENYVSDYFGLEPDVRDGAEDLTGLDRSDAPDDPGFPVAVLY